MIDTIKIQLQLFMSDILKLKIFRFHGDGLTGEITNHSACLRNLRINFDERTRVLTIVGSIPKFYRGENITIISASEIKLAFEEISNSLGIDIDKARILRLDYGVIIEHSLNNVQPLFDCLGDFPRLNRILVKNGETLSYRSTTRELQFYDKLRESKIFPIDGVQKLRFEIRHFKNIKYFFKGDLKCCDLYNPIFLIDLNSDVLQKYNGIKKRNYGVITADSFSSLRNFKDAMAVESIKNIGSDHILKQLYLNKNKTNRSAVDKIKRFINQPTKQLYGNEFIEILDKGIQIGLEENLEKIYS